MINKIKKIEVMSTIPVLTHKPLNFARYLTRIEEILIKSTHLRAIGNEDLMSDDTLEDFSSNEIKKEKQKKKNKLNKDVEINTINDPSATIRLSAMRPSVDYEMEKSGKSVKAKRPLTEKEKSAKKTRLKNKYLASYKIINKIANMNIPGSLYRMVKKARLELIELDLYQQKAILDIASELSKEELTIMLLMLPETTEEMKFLKSTLLSRQFIDTLFRNISNDLIK